MQELFDDVATAEDNIDDSDLRQKAREVFGKRRANQMTDDEIVEELGKNSFN